MNRNTIWGTVAVGLLLILGGLANQQEAVDVDSTTKIKNQSHIFLPRNTAIPDQVTLNVNYDR